MHLAINFGNVTYFGSTDENWPISGGLLIFTTDAPWRQSHLVATRVGRTRLPGLMTNLPVERISKKVARILSRRVRFIIKSGRMQMSWMPQVFPEAKCQECRRFFYASRSLNCNQRWRLITRISVSLTYFPFCRGNVTWSSTRKVRELWNSNCCHAVEAAATSNFGVKLRLLLTNLTMN